MLVDITKPSIWCFAIFVSVTFVQSSGQIGQSKLTTFGSSDSAGKSVVRKERATSSYQYFPNGGTPSELLYTADGYFAGENTPVWMVHKNRGQAPFPVRLTDGYVKKAIDWWKKKSPSNRGYGNLTHSKTAPDPQYRYPSVLAVLDYKNHPYPGVSGSVDKWIYEGILYALAFWNGVDLQLRYIKDPSVRIHLAGIVLSRTRDATPYIKNNEDDDGELDAEDAIGPMMAYWKGLARTDPGFNTKAYDTVATMTDVKRKKNQDGRDWSDPTAADTRTPCLGSLKGINGLIVHDSLDFAGIQPAVHSMARILGAKRGGSCAVKGTVMETSNGTPDGGYKRKWSVCTLQEIGTHLLEHGSCMRTPKGDYTGKKIEHILPGQLKSVKEICQTHEDGPLYDCFESMKKSPCGEYICAENKWNHQCGSIHVPVADGTKCDGGFTAKGRKICLDGICVNNPLP